MIYDCTKGIDCIRVTTKRSVNSHNILASLSSYIEGRETKNFKVSNEPLKGAEQLTLKYGTAGVVGYETKFMTSVAICEAALVKYFNEIPKNLYFQFEPK